MPTSITASNGNVYHLWQLPDLSAPEPESSIEFTVLENTLSEGYSSHSLFGSVTGVRSWKLDLPTLAGSSVIAANVTDPYGATVSREQYIRNLFKYNKSVKPFVYIDPVNGQYYLVDFVENDLTMARQRGVNIRSTSFTLRQRRLNGVTVFNVAAMPGAANTFSWYDNSSLVAGTWTDHGSPAGGALTGSFTTSTQNGLNVARFSGTSASGTPAKQIYEICMVCKMREATFGSGENLLQINSIPVLKGSSGTDQFATSGGTGVVGASWYVNGVESTTAPMNTWGIVNMRRSAGWNGNGGIVIGSGAAVDVAEVILFGGLNALKDNRELVESMSTKWGITI